MDPSGNLQSGGKREGARKRISSCVDMRGTLVEKQEREERCQSFYSTSFSRESSLKTHSTLNALGVFLFLFFFFLPLTPRFIRIKIQSVQHLFEAHLGVRLSAPERKSD